MTTATKTKSYLVFSMERMAWWRRDAAGYTTDVTEAGRYSEERARSSTERCTDREEVMVREDVALAMIHVERTRVARASEDDLMRLEVRQGMKSRLSRDEAYESAYSTLDDLEPEDVIPLDDFARSKLADEPFERTEGPR